MDAYASGATIEQLAERFGVHRTTVGGHLDRERVGRREKSRGWDDEALALAAAFYAGGASLATVAARFGVDPSTVANRFRRAGITIRARRGWG